MKRSPRLVLLALAALVVGLLPAAASSAADVPTSSVITGRITGSTEPMVSVDNLDRYNHVSQTYPIESDGRYTIYGLDAGRYAVRAWDDRGRTAWEYFGGTRRLSEAIVITITKAGQIVSGVNIDLDAVPVGTVTGTVDVGGQSQDRSTRTSVWYQDGRTWRPVPTSRNEDQGSSFRVEGLPAGEYRVYWQSWYGSYGRSSGFHGGVDDAEAGTPVLVSANETTDVTVTPRGTGAIEGRLLDAKGDPFDDVRVDVFRVSADGPDAPVRDWRKDTRTDDDGRYTIPGLDSGQYFLKFTTPTTYRTMYSGGAFDYPDEQLTRAGGLPPAATRLITVRAEKTTVWSDETFPGPGSMAGTTRDPEGRIIPHTKVTVTPILSGNEGRTGEGTPISTLSDDDGRYVVPNLEHGRYEVEAFDTEGYSGQYRYFDRERYAKDKSRWASTVKIEPGTELPLEIDLDTNGAFISDPDPLYGQRLTTKLLFAPRVDLARDPGTTWQWMRDGKPIAGATHWDYRVTARDVGHFVTAVATLKRGGVTEVRPSHNTNQTAKPDWPSGTLTARALGDGAVRLRLTMDPFQAPRRLIDGTVTIDRRRPGADRIGSKQMKDGSLVMTLRNQPRGRQRYTTTFLAPGRFLTRSETIVVRVR